MKKNIYLISLILLLLTISSLSAQEQEFLTYENTDFGFKIGYPADWETAELKEKNLFGFISPIEDENDFFRESLNLVVIESSEDAELDELVGALTKQLESEGSKIIESSAMILAENPAHKLVFTEEWENTVAVGGGKITSEIKGKTAQIITIKNNFVYFITFVAEENKYEKYSPIFEKMIDSLKIGKTEEMGVKERTGITSALLGLYLAMGAVILLLLGYILKNISYIKIIISSFMGKTKKINEEEKRRLKTLFLVVGIVMITIPLFIYLAADNSWWENLLMDLLIIFIFLGISIFAIKWMFFFGEEGRQKFYKKMFYIGIVGQAGICGSLSYELITGSLTLGKLLSALLSIGVLLVAIITFWKKMRGGKIKPRK